MIRLETILNGATIISELVGVIIDNSGLYTIPFTPSATNGRQGIRVSITANGAGTTAYDPGWYKVTDVPQNTVVRICNTGLDRYRFGFNTQEKTNEIAGVGNHYTALHWEYDTRIGRRWNRDSVKDHSQSPYATFNGNPIANTDHLRNVGEPVVKDGQLTIYSHILFYGGAATPALANQAASNIQSGWTSANGTVTYKGVEYHDVKFVVTAQVVSEKTAQYRASQNGGENYDPRLNFARIESRAGLPENTPNRVSGHAGRGDNSMFLIAEDINAENTSQSHEFGHGFGIGKHISSFERFHGPPRIMTTLHTAVDAPYTIDGQEGVPQGKNVIPLHRLNHNCRQVTQDDISDMDVNQYSNPRQSKGLGADGYRVGNSSNDLFNSNGSTVSETPPAQR